MKLKKEWTKLIIALVLVIGFAAWVFPKKVMHRLSFFWTNGYYFPIYASLVFAFLLVIFKLAKKYNKEHLVKYIYGILFIPAAIFPMIKCFFKVPYIFCKACPKKCMWGELAPMIVPSFLLLNIDKRAWCFKMCPVGTLQDFQCKVTKKRIHLPKWLRILRPSLLIFTIIVVMGLFINSEFLNWFYKGTHHFYVWSFTIIVLIFLLAFFIPRFWCNYFCPIGAAGDLVLKTQKVKDKV